MDETILKEISVFLSGGWASIILGIMLAAFLLWWAFNKHSVLEEVAKKKSIDEANEVEQREREKSANQDKKDEQGRKDSDSFLNDSNAK